MYLIHTAQLSVFVCFYTCVYPGLSQCVEHIRYALISGKLTLYRKSADGNHPISKCVLFGIKYNTQDNHIHVLCLYLFIELTLKQWNYFPGADSTLSHELP